MDFKNLRTPRLPKAPLAKLKIRKPFLDSDGDGRPNTMDCEPYNPRKQGMIHEIGKGVAKKALPKSLGIRKSETEYMDRRSEIAKVRTQARQEHAIKYAKEAERLKSEANIRLLKESLKEKKKSPLRMSTDPFGSMVPMSRAHSQTRIRKKGTKQKSKDYGSFGDPNRTPWF